MQGILYVSHGSRIKEATNEAVEFITSVKKLVNIPLQESCFLELAEPNVTEGIDNLVKQGASRISIVPVLLLSAGHYFKDIPEVVNQSKEKYPEITFTYGQPLGVQDQFTTILAERIEETNVPVKADAKILLVGRGSRNPQTKIDIKNIANKLQGQTNIQVDICFLAACEPSFEQGIQSSLSEEHSQIFIVPYLWFTGVLMDFLETKVSDLFEADKEFVLCRQLGDHPAMKNALKERVYESIK
ncbi:sirohydrochlorin chelatase [Oceanobacillus rekensis]|uniref:sirohydrochlorin chelatase n=1 Tax=Oceanobacillus rekensis TaxID=937927 RepID=UPI000B43E682|nr:sirohydrochlorin chelatase [Oceanobacillus rekensis]